MLNFPSSPTNGQSFTSGSREWIFITGKGWSAAGSSAPTGPQGPIGPSTFVAASSANSAYQDFHEDTDNGTNKVRVKAPDALAADATVNYPGVSGDLLSTAESKTITAGFKVDPNDLGTISSGTVTPDAANHNYQFYINNGAHTLATPADDCAIDIEVTNGASAGPITFSGFKTPGSGAAGATYATTNGAKWLISIRRINSSSYYCINGPWT